MQRAIRGAWERGFWLLSDGTELSALHLPPLCEYRESGSPARSSRGAELKDPVTGGQR